MNLTLELFGKLVLTFLGFILPIIGVMLAIFSEGLALLSQQYGEEKEQAAKNIKDQLKKIGKSHDEIKENEVEKNLDELKRIKKEAEKKLSFLNPKKQIAKVFILLILSYIATSISSVLTEQVNPYYVTILRKPTLLASLVFTGGIFLFVYCMWHLWILFGIIIEIKKISDERKDQNESSFKQSIIALSKKGEFLKKVFVEINDITIAKDDLEFKLTSQEKKDLKVNILNSEQRVVKNVEIGLIFPLSFIIEKSDRYSIYKDENTQVVRFKKDLVHSKTRLKFGNIAITPLVKETHKIKTFISAENVEYITRKLIIVVD